jgi:hypothetical protein
MEGVGGRKFFAREPSAKPRRFAAGRSDFLSSEISHKIGSSGLKNILQNFTFRFFTKHLVGGSQSRPLVLWGEILSARRAVARLAVGQDEVRNLLRFVFALPQKEFLL